MIWNKQKIGNCCYEPFNFHKNEIFCYREAKEIEDCYTNLFGCGLGQYPFRYLGIGMHHKKIGNADWKIIEEN
jgi:hypothetical protein